MIHIIITPTLKYYQPTVGLHRPGEEMRGWQKELLLLFRFFIDALFLRQVSYLSVGWTWTRWLQSSLGSWDQVEDQILQQRCCCKERMLTKVGWSSRPEQQLVRCSGNRSTCTRAANALSSPWQKELSSGLFYMHRTYLALTFCAIEWLEHTYIIIVRNYWHSSQLVPHSRQHSIWAIKLYGGVANRHSIISHCVKSGQAQSWRQLKLLSIRMHCSSLLDS